MAGPASAELYEELIRHGDKVYTDTLRMIFGIWKKEGRIPGTVIPTKEEEFRLLTAELPFLQQVVQTPTSPPEDIVNANAKLIRWQELQREMGNGTQSNGNTPQS